MVPYLYFNIINLLLWMVLGKTNAIKEAEPEDHLARPEMDYNEDYEDVTLSYNDHNNDNDHLTSSSTELNVDPEHETSSEVDSLPLDEQLTTENELFEDNESYDERTTSRMLDVLSRGLLKMQRKPEPNTDYEPPVEYEIEDRIVRYALNSMHEEI